MAGPDASVDIVVPQPVLRTEIPPVADPHRYPILPVDLLAYMPQGITIDDTTTPSTADVQLMITNVCDRINGVLNSRGFAMPLQTALIDSAGLSFLNTCCTYGVIARWARTKYPSDTGPGGSKGFSEDYSKMFEDFLKQITAGAISLPEEPRAVVSHGFGDGPTDFHDDMRF